MTQLTVIPLGITGKLRRTLEPTNPWESTIDTPCHHLRAARQLTFRDELACRRSHGAAITDDDCNRHTGVNSAFFTLRQTPQPSCTSGSQGKGHAAKSTITVELEDFRSHVRR